MFTIGVGQDVHPMLQSRPGQDVQPDLAEFQSWPRKDFNPDLFKRGHDNFVRIHIVIDSIKKNAVKIHIDLVKIRREDFLETEITWLRRRQACAGELVTYSCASHIKSYSLM